MTTKEMNKEVAEWLGLCWHEFAPKSEDDWATMVCSKCGKETNNLSAQFSVAWNPDFSQGAGIIRLLEEMRKRSDFSQFANNIYFDFIKVDSRTENYLRAFTYIPERTIPIVYITAPGLLLKAAWEFFRRSEGGQDANHD